MRVILLISLIVLTAASVAASEWELDREADGIKVYSSDVEGSRYRAFRGVVELETSLPSAVGLLDDTSACEDWLHLCQESRVLKELDWSERFVYQVTNLPFPAATRDAIFKAGIAQLDNGDVRVELSSQPDFIPETRYVRIRKGEGSYLLEPIDDTTIRLTWTMHIEPGGSLPAFLVNRLLTDIPFNSLRDFRKLVMDERYQVLEFQRNENGRAIGLLNKAWKN